MAIVRTILIAIVAAAAFVAADDGPSCPTLSSTYSVSDYNPNLNAYDGSNLAVYPCSCTTTSYSTGEESSFGEGYCISNGIAVLDPIWLLVLQDDTHDYKWYPAWDQYVELGDGSSYNANPKCRLTDGATAMPSDWLPAPGYNATERFQLTKRCNIAANYCGVTGHQCFSESSFDSLDDKAFNVSGVACTDDYNGQPFWGVANVLVQWQHYQFEQCWSQTIATGVGGRSNGGGGGRQSGASERAQVSVWLLTATAGAVGALLAAVGI